MAKKEINVIGILIDTEYDDFKLYKVGETWEKSEREGTYNSTSTSCVSSVEGLEPILRFLSSEKNPATQFLIVYDVSCPKKKRAYKKTSFSSFRNK